MLDPDDVRDALAGCCPPRPKRRGDWTEPATPDDDQVAAFGRTVSGFLEELPGHYTIHELREALEDL